MKFQEMDLTAVGQTVQLVGGIWAGDGHAYLCYFPEYGREFEPVAVEMNAEDWKALIRQSDLVETDVLARAPNGDLVKTVMRKCQRTIEEQLKCQVFRRDGFRCRYCGREDVPLTVDHLILWEDGGPTIEPHLLAACRKCNKARGRTPYAKWLTHPYYLQVSSALTNAERLANVDWQRHLATMPRVVHVRTR